MSYPAPFSDAVTELLIRYEQGEFSPRIRARLAEIFRDDPPDALELLHKAATYTGCDGVGLEQVIIRYENQPNRSEVAA